ncbi:hypothetical protein EXIGLDRAFT_752231 [Exidia glandulosa HHB12029]|uniref:Uncharacterized protein n=1 Tax=Exidia glandulosa HHB12029 TaxID=1314781 RepID=A0A165EPV2_EXIGL|nr:hypothetical protein EXIGLDRAFT_752231 [Exidia glandulosa HHB12029]
MSLPDAIQDQARKAAGRAWATALELNELAADVALIDLGDVKTSFDIRFVARYDEHLDAIAASTGEKRKAVDDGNNPRQPRRVTTPILELRVVVGELVDDVLGGEESDIEWCVSYLVSGLLVADRRLRAFWTASRLDAVRELIKTWLEVYHVAPLHVLLEFQRSSSDDDDDDEGTPYLSDDDDDVSPLSTSASPPTSLAVTSDSSPASSPRDDLDSSSDMVLSSPPSSPGLELPDDVREPRWLRTLDELASFVSEPAHELANVDIDVPAADAFDGLLTRLGASLASWQTLFVRFDQPLLAKDLQALRQATKTLSCIPADNLRHVQYDVAGADAFPISPRSPLCSRVGGYLGALRKTADKHGAYQSVTWLDVLDATRTHLLTAATIAKLAPNLEVLTLRAPLTDTTSADLGRTLPPAQLLQDIETGLPYARRPCSGPKDQMGRWALLLDQRSGDGNWRRQRLERTLHDLRADRIPIVGVTAPLKGTVTVALASVFARGQHVHSVTLVEDRNVRRLSLAAHDQSWVLDEVSPVSVAELVKSLAWKAVTEVSVSNRLSDDFLEALYKSPPLNLEVLTVVLTDDSPDPPDGTFLAPLGTQAWVCPKLTTLVLTARAPESPASRLFPQTDLCVGQRPTVSAKHVARFITNTEVAQAQFQIVLRGLDFAGGLAEARKVLPGVTIISDRPRS